MDKCCKFIWICCIESIKCARHSNPIFASTSRRRMIIAYHQHRSRAELQSEDAATWQPMCANSGYSLLMPYSYYSPLGWTCVCVCVCFRVCSACAHPDIQLRSYSNARTPTVLTICTFIQHSYRNTDNFPLSLVWMYAHFLWWESKRIHTHRAVLRNKAIRNKYDRTYFVLMYTVHQWMGFYDGILTTELIIEIINNQLIILIDWAISNTHAFLPDFFRSTSNQQ